MKAIVCRSFGPPEDLKLEEIPEPDMLPGHVRLGVKACSINFADALMVQGLYQDKPPFPFSPGLEAAGDILEVGEGVKGFKPGMRVAALCGHGGLAEQVVVPAGVCMPIPNEMSYTHAAAFSIAYGTSHVALDHRGKLKKGETLLVHGAAGGVGLTAVELGKLMGASVIATASTPEKLELARAYGADHLINYREENFRDRVKEITNGRYADVIFDPVGGDVFDLSMRSIAWEGRILVIGFASGRIPELPANLALVKNCSVVGVYWGKYSQRNPAVLLESLQQLMQWYSQGKLKPHVNQTFPLSESVEAMHTLMNRKAQGKVVVEI